MKFYEGEEKLSNVISSYSINDNNSLCIKYLDGSETIYNGCNKDVIEKINNLMLLQLIDSNNNFNIDKERGKYYFNFLFLLSFIGVYTAYCAKDRSYSFSMSTLFVLTSTFLAYEKRKANFRIKEYKKNEMFLEMYDKLKTPEGQKIVGELFFDKIYGMDLDVNSLDKFTYGEVKETYKKMRKYGK